MDHLIFVKLACIPNFSFLSELEVTFPGGWLDTDNKSISVQFNLTGTATGTELGKNIKVISDVQRLLVSIEESRMSFKTPWRMISRHIRD